MVVFNFVVSLLRYVFRETVNWFRKNEDFGVKLVSNELRSANGLDKFKLRLWTVGTALFNCTHRK